MFKLSQAVTSCVQGVCQGVWCVPVGGLCGSGFTFCFGFVFVWLLRGFSFVFILDIVTLL